MLNSPTIKDYYRTLDRYADCIYSSEYVGQKGTILSGAMESSLLNSVKQDLLDSHIYIVAPRLVRTIDAAVIHHLREDICGFEPVQDGWKASREEIREFLTKVPEAVTQAPLFGTAIPHPMFIGFGTGLRMGGAEAILKMSSGGPNEVLDGMIDNIDNLQAISFGFLISPIGLVMEWAEVNSAYHNSRIAVVGCHRLPSLGWMASATTVPWTIPCLVEAILNSGFRERKANRKILKRLSKNLKWQELYGPGLPPPYHLVDLEEETLVAALAPVGYTPPPPRVKVRRGRFPLDSDLRSKLVKKGFTVYAEHTLSEEHAKLLADNKQDPRLPDEWIAIQKI